MKRCSNIINNKGLSLIDVMIAVAIVAGAGLMVSSYITNQMKITYQVQDASTCQSAVNAVINEIKSTDNLRNIDSWLPGKVNGAGNPLTDYHIPPGDIANRYVSPLFTSLNKNDITNSTFLNVSANQNMNTYAPAETSLATRANNYQLIDNSITSVASYYNSNPAYCNTGVDVASGGSDYLSLIVSKNISATDTLKVRIQKVNVDSGSIINDCNAWSPLPINANANAISNHNQGFRVTTTLTYTDKSNQQRTCNASATVSPHADTTAPTAAVSMYVIPVELLQQMQWQRRRGGYSGDYEMTLGSKIFMTLLC